MSYSFTPGTDHVDMPAPDLDEMPAPPAKRHNPFMEWTLAYLNPLLRIGATRPLVITDVPGVGDTDSAKFIHEEITRHWDAQTQRPRSMAKALIDSFGRWNFLVALFYYLVAALLKFVPVLILNDLVRYFESGGNTNGVVHVTFAHPWILVAGLGLLPMFITLLETRHNVIMLHASVFVRTAVSTMLYQKSLSVSNTGRGRTSTGQVVNMMSNDTAQLQRFLLFLGFSAVAPIQISLCLYLIHRQVGAATWVGIGFMFCLAPINIVVFGRVSRFRRLTLKYSDARVKLINEVLSGIRIIKFYAWERPFKKSIDSVREEELQSLTKLAYTAAIGFSMVLLSAPIIQPILVFMTYTKIQDQPLDAATAFTTVALFGIMRFPFAFLPMGLLQYIQSKIALKRIATYMELPELKDYIQDGNGELEEESDEKSPSPCVVIKNSSFKWINEEENAIAEARAAALVPTKKGKGKGKVKTKPKGKNDIELSAIDSVDPDSVDVDVVFDPESDSTAPDTQFTLKDISVTFEQGKLYAVVGTVGSGKSSLLSAILGEMEPCDSAPSSTDKVLLPLKKNNVHTSYSSQTPWVVNDTLQNNILFSRPYDKDRYDRVVEACCLTDDLSVLPAGDMTEIGERGINLSGGQKARVSLARALYSADVQLLLMDDPLSAVDSNVGEHLFDQAIASTTLCPTATKVLVTHHVHFLHRCDAVVVMEAGKVAHFGKFDNLVKSGVDFNEAIKFEEKEKAVEEESSPKDETIDVKEERKKRSRTMSGEHAVDAKAKAGESNTAFTKEAISKGKELVKNEEREEGSIDSKAYYYYGGAGGWIYVWLIVFIQGSGRAFEIAGTFWLAKWANENVAALISGTPLSDKDTKYYLNIYALLCMIGVFCLTVRAILMATHRLKASRKIHDDLTTNIMRAPVSFYDVTPLGRILNRFAADMDKIDLELTQSLGQGVGTLFSVLGAAGAIIAATKGTMLAPFLPLSYLYFLVQRWFRKSSTELQRVESITKSPIFTDFSQTLSGTSSIRAYGVGSRFFAKCVQSFDINNAAFIMTQLTNNWLGIRLDVLGGVIAAFIGGIAVATEDTNFISAGWLGLALSYSIEVTGFLKHGVRMIAQVEAQMNSVERVLSYVNDVEPEADQTTDNDPTSDWPTKGKIKVNELSLRYRDGPEVLKKISFEVEPGEKVGVVGRTGSGKSSLMTSLFRIVESSHGNIEIDGVDINKIGTEPLRTALSIIPQDPVLFSNTVKYNLDPFNTVTDDELWSVLAKVQLTEVVEKLPGKMEEVIVEGGENFSQGQRQLICIARSLLRKPKILVLDEATASIDNYTDSLIQKMVREEFKEATVLTIAHRLNTILDSDRILVLDDGEIADYDTPAKLLEKEGLFRTLVEHSNK